jgi:hypothetical protein
VSTSPLQAINACYIFTEVFSERAGVFLLYGKFFAVSIFLQKSPAIYAIIIALWLNLFKKGGLC